ncbi:acyl-CoA desaturase [Mumia sp. zg.B17]|uniref:fatty acid desaturase family protein n=1 Tax=unclassified Mumia TaxID=2621872 RepID=UPI001C6E7CFB|nr:MULTISPECIES: acyl-CoA desaturase [unclassified Mumia]MBW9207803.1 acyl-CoA desaturase [Mumia sp. zg.B17]MDD9350060.1 acyl-CoA desaturase [Mumia sp.]
MTLQAEPTRPSAHPTTARFSELLNEVRDHGLLERRHGWYAVRITATIGAFFALWVAFFLIGDSWWQLAVAAALGFVMTQFGFLGHDAAHRQIFRSGAANAWAARVLACGFAGLSYGWWRAKHNKHHKGPNQEVVDPDIAPGALAFTPEIVQQRRTAFGRWFAANQGWFFFPLLTLEGLNLHYASVRTTMDRSSGLPWRRLELTVVSLRLLAFVVILLVALPLGMAVAFFAVQMAVFGVLLGMSFAPNHKGMPIVPEAMRLDFLRRQVLVSRNVRGGPFTDLMMGGLNYQIEHHLFPSMPRVNLRRAQPIVRRFCERHGVPYTEVGLLRSYRIVVDYLNNVGLRARDPFDCPLAAQLRTA